MNVRDCSPQYITLNPVLGVCWMGVGGVSIVSQQDDQFLCMCTNYVSYLVSKYETQRSSRVPRMAINAGG